MNKFRLYIFHEIIPEVIMCASQSATYPEAHAVSLSHWLAVLLLITWVRWLCQVSSGKVTFPCVIKNLVEDTLSLDKHPVFHSHSFIHFNIHWWFLLETVTTMGAASGGFLKTFIPSILVSWHSPVKKSVFFSFICLFIHIYIYFTSINAWIFILLYGL